MKRRLIIHAPWLAPIAGELSVLIALTIAAVAS